LKQKFINHNFHAPSLKMIAQANEIIERYMTAGYTITLRQLHYQFVQRKHYTNTYNNYQKLIDIVDKGRRAGLIDWDAIEDRTRNLMSIPNYDSPQQFLNTVMRQYAEPLWFDQDVYCEVWVEKDALIGVVERPCNKMRVGYMACRGYMSSSEQYAAGQRFMQKYDEGKRCIIFYLGDHDPSGIDMARNNSKKNELFGDGSAEVIRLGLNMDQIEELDLAPDYAKEKDSRIEGYRAEFGTDYSWELDALEPEYIDNLITTAIEGVCDMEKFNAALVIETTNKTRLKSVTDSFYDVARFLELRNDRGLAKELLGMSVSEVLNYIEGWQGETDG
jgi:hypothetical protein